MKKITLFVEDDFLKILEDFKKNALKNPKTSDEKAMILITRYFMKCFNEDSSTAKT